jgi:hypothetical protein
LLLLLLLIPLRRSVVVPALVHCHQRLLLIVCVQCIGQRRLRLSAAKQWTQPKKLLHLAAVLFAEETGKIRIFNVCLLIKSN